MNPNTIQFLAFVSSGATLILAIVFILAGMIPVWFGLGVALLGAGLLALNIHSLFTYG